MDKNKEEVNPNSTDYQFGKLIAEVRSVHDKVDALDKKYMTIASVVSFSVSLIVTIVGFFIGK